MRTLIKLALVAACTASFGLWLLNLIYAIETVAKIHLVGLRAEAMPYLARVDQSTVTTLVVLLTLFAITRGQFRLDRFVAKGGKPANLWHPHFPFSAGFRNLLIQLGLLGTIFAFIVAFNEMATAAGAEAAAYNPAVLIEPLGTALWSTFAGIAVAFLVVPPVEAWYARRLSPPMSSPQASTETEALARALTDLTERVSLSNKGLGQFQDRVTQLTEILERLKAVASVAALLEQLDGSMNQLTAAVSQLTPVMASTRQTVAELHSPARVVVTQTQSLAVAIERHSEVDRALSENMAGNTRALAVLGDPRQAVGALGTAVRGISTGLDGVARAVEMAAEAPRWPALEGSALGRELGELKSTLAGFEARVGLLLREATAVRSHGIAPPRRVSWFAALLRRLGGGSLS